MHVKDLLAGRLTICKEEVHAFTAKRRVPKRGCRELSDSLKLGTVLGVEVCQIGGVPPWHDEHVALHDRLDVHEGHRQFVLVHDAYLFVALREPTK